MKLETVGPVVHRAPRHVAELHELAGVRAADFPTRNLRGDDGKPFRRAWIVSHIHTNGSDRAEEPQAEARRQHDVAQLGLAQSLPDVAVIEERGEAQLV